jgi:hypothetical protein
MSTEPGSDPIGDFQRWLMKAGARSIGRQVAGRVKSTVGGATGRGTARADVWHTATTEVPVSEPPECQWCPICRAARGYRDSGGTGIGTATLGGQFAGVADTLAGLTKDAFSLFDTAVRASQRPPAGTPSPWAAAGDPPAAPGNRTPAGAAPAGTGPVNTAPVNTGPVNTGPADTVPPGTVLPETVLPETGPEAEAKPAAPAAGGPSDHGAVVVGPGIGWPTVIHAQHQDDEPADERGDREEGGQPGDGSAGGGADEQVERTAE